MKNLLICGGTGFIGRNLVEYYSKASKFKITATHFSRPPLLEYNNVNWRHCDLRDPNQVKNLFENQDIVLQFAAITTGAKDVINNPHIFVTDNAIMNSVIFREAFEKNIEHLIFPSCTIMYQSSDSQIKESDFCPSDPMNEFYFGAAHTKVYLEKMCEFYSNFKRSKFTVMRHSNIYGPYDKYNLEKSHVLPATITKVLNTKDDFITVWGQGLEKRDLLYIDDLLNFIDLAIDKQEDYFKLYNVGLGQAISIKDLVDKIIYHSKMNLNIKHDLTKPSIPTSISLNCEKAKNELDWHPKISLDEGIYKTIEWYKKWNKMDTN